MRTKTMEILRRVRRETKVDWAVRDLVIKSVINMINKGTKEKDIWTYIDYLNKKLRQDTAHTIILYRIKSYFERYGFTVVINAIRVKSFDMVAFNDRRIFFVEVKAGAPPWRGNNFREYNTYFNLERLSGNILYVWEERGRYYCTTYSNVELIDNEVKVRERYLLRNFIEANK